MDFRLLRHGKKERRRNQRRPLFKDMFQKVKMKCPGASSNT